MGSIGMKYFFSITILATAYVSLTVLETKEQASKPATQDIGWHRQVKKNGTGIFFEQLKNYSPISGDPRESYIPSTVHGRAHMGLVRCTIHGLVGGLFIGASMV